jgi:ABC-type phosphate/phosphonate transport system ATPase subunit
MKIVCISHCFDLSITNFLIVPIHVLADDPLIHIDNISSSTIEQDSLLSNKKDDILLFKNIHTLDLSKLNLDDLLLLLYRLQQKTTKNSVKTSISTISSSSSSSSSNFIGSY